MSHRVFKTKIATWTASKCVFLFSLITWKKVMGKVNNINMFQRVYFIVLGEVSVLLVW